MPTFQNYLSDKTILTELASSDEALVKGLKNRQYDMVILHTLPDDNIFDLVLRMVNVIDYGLCRVNTRTRTCNLLNQGMLLLYYAFLIIHKAAG